MRLRHTEGVQTEVVGLGQKRNAGNIVNRMLKMELPGRRQRGGLKGRVIDVVKAHMQGVGEEEENPEDRRREKLRICCGRP